MCTQDLNFTNLSTSAKFRNFSIVSRGMAKPDKLERGAGMVVRLLAARATTDNIIKFYMFIERDPKIMG